MSGLHYIIIAIGSEKYNYFIILNIHCDMFIMMSFGWSFDLKQIISMELNSLYKVQTSKEQAI